MPGVQLSFEFGQRREAPGEYWGEFWHERGVSVVPEQAKMRCQALLKLLQQALLTAACLPQDLLSAVGTFRSHTAPECPV